MKIINTPTFGNLQGINVLSCSSAIAAPLAAELFAEQGADVIQVENPKVPELIRSYALGFSAERRNMRTLAIDIFSNTGLQALEKMLVWADVLIESSKGGTWVSKGLSDEELWKINSALVIVHVSGFGQTGDPKYVSRGSYDSIGQAFSGYILLNGMSQDSVPLIPKPLPNDYFTGCFAAYGALAALYRTKATGKGESIDVAQFEATLRVQLEHVIDGVNLGIEAERVGNKVKSVGQRIYKCADGNWVYFEMGVGKRLVPTLELIGLGDDPDIPHDVTLLTYDIPGASEKVIAAMQKFCDERTAAEVEEEVMKIDGIACQLMTYKGMLENSHYVARQSIIEWDDPNAGKTIKGVAPVPKFKNNPSQVWRGGPTYGMDNEDILLEFGYSDAEIQEMYDAKILLKK